MKKREARLPFRIVSRTYPNAYKRSAEYARLMETAPHLVEVAAACCVRAVTSIHEGQITVTHEVCSWKFRRFVRDANNGDPVEVERELKEIERLRKWVESTPELARKKARRAR